MPSVTRERLALDVLELADAGGMPDTYRLTDQRVGRALDVLEDLGVDVPAAWTATAEARAKAGAWAGGAAAEATDGK